MAIKSLACSAFIAVPFLWIKWKNKIYEKYDKNVKSVEIFFTDNFFPFKVSSLEKLNKEKRKERSGLINLEKLKNKF